MPSAYNFTQKAQLGTWIVEIDPRARYGCFENDQTGAGGGLWFGPTERGNLELSDYDGVFALPKPVGACLIRLGYTVSRDCFNDDKLPTIAMVNAAVVA